MAMNRSLHCIFRHASNPHVIGASPFTKVSENQETSSEKNESML